MKHLKSLQFTFRRPAQAQRGQSLVEMALMMTIILVILSAVIDLGRGFFSYVAIYNAAAEGALYAAINPWCPTSAQPGCDAPNNVIYRAQHESPSGLVDNARMEVNVIYNDGTRCAAGAACSPASAAMVEGTPVTVTVVYRMNMIGPFSPTFPNGEVPFLAHAVQQILDIQ